jgi:hypothetical protein
MVWFKTNLVRIYTNMFRYVFNLFLDFSKGSCASPKLVKLFSHNPLCVYKILIFCLILILVAAIIPSLLATILIFMDQHITAVIVNRAENKLKVSFFCKFD